MIKLAHTHCHHFTVDQPPTASIQCPTLPFDAVVSSMIADKKNRKRAM